MKLANHADINTILNARRRERFVIPSSPTNGKETDKTSNCSRGSRCTLEVVWGRTVKMIDKVFSIFAGQHSCLTDTKSFM